MQKAKLVHIDFLKFIDVNICRHFYSQNISHIIIIEPKPIELALPTANATIKLKALNLYLGPKLSVVFKQGVVGQQAFRVFK